MERDKEHQQPQQQPQDKGGRGGDPNHIGGASKPGHLSPQIDAKDGDPDRQISSKPQQASGQGSGQS